MLGFTTIQIVKKKRKNEENYKQRLTLQPYEFFFLIFLCDQRGLSVFQTWRQSFTSYRGN